MSSGSRTKKEAKKRPYTSSIAEREAAESLPPPSRPAYHIGHALKRAPSYLFAFIHVCYLHTLVTAFYVYIIRPLLLGRGESTDVRALSTHLRGMTTDLIIKALLPPQETKRWWRFHSPPAETKVDKPFLKKQIIVRQLWSSPATMFFLFGIAYFAVNGVICALRILYCSLRHLYRVYRHRQSEPVVSVYTLVRYGNGYDAIVRLLFGVVELVWFVRYIHHYYDDGAVGYVSPPVTSQVVSAVGGGGGGGSGGGGAAGNGGHSANGIRGTGASAALPLPSFSPGGIVSADFVKAFLVFGIQFVIALTAILDVQRIFHAVVGVRPLVVPNGWECCPLCGANWKVSRRTANKVHICPRLWPATATPAGNSYTPLASAASPVQPVSTAAGQQPSRPLSNSDDDDVASIGSSSSLGEANLPLGVTFALGRKQPRRMARPGDVFPDPNTVSAWSSFTYSWLSPLLNVALLSPFGTFSSPPADAFAGGGTDLWRAQLSVVSRLPPLPNSMKTAEYIGDPIWLLWKTRRRTAEEDAAIASRHSKLELAFLHVTGPLRRVLAKAFVLYFLPPSPPPVATPPPSQATSASRGSRWARLLRWLRLRKDAAPVADTNAAVGSRPSPLPGPGSPLGAETASPRRSSRSRLYSVFSLSSQRSTPPSSPSRQSSIFRISRQKTVKKSLFKLFLEHPIGRDYVYKCVPYKLIEDALSLVAPQVVRALVQFLREVGTTVATAPPRKKTGRERYFPAPGEHFFLRGLSICALLVVVVFLQSLFFQAYLAHLYTAAMAATSGLKMMLLRRTLETPLALMATKDPHAPQDDDDSDEDEEDGLEDGLEDDDAGVDDGDETNLAASTRLLARPRPPSPPHAGDVSVVADLKPSREGDDGTQAEQRKGGAAVADRQDSSVSTNKSTARVRATATAASSLASESEVVSLFTIDAGNCGDALIFLHNVWGHPVIIVSSLLSMYSYVGFLSTFATFMVLVAMTPINKASATRVRVAQQRSKDSSARMGFLNALLSSMRTIKSMALEACMWKNIETARINESDGRKQVASAVSAAAAQTELTTLLITLVCFGTYLLTGGKMDAAVLVPTMAALNVMRFPLWTLPQIFSQVSRGYTSLQRIEQYLQGSGSRPTRRSPQRQDSSISNLAEFGSPTSPASAAHSVTHPSSSPDSVDDLALPPAAGAHGELLGAVHCDCCSFAWRRQKEASVPLPQSSPLLLDQSAASSMQASTSSPLGRSPAPAFRGSSTYSLSTGVPAAASSAACVLKNIDVRINPGEFVVIQGATGSGKSALLLAMMGELYPMAPSGPRHPSRVNSYMRLGSRNGAMPHGSPTSVNSDNSLSNLDSSREMISEVFPSSPRGTRRAQRHSQRPRGFTVDGRVAYCCEVPWLRDQTIRENIRLIPDVLEDGEVLESAADQAWYEKVLAACALTRDIASMPLGDRTVVGENGSKLSGGQRARVALARAVYRRDVTDIFLLDDILSALDVEVQKHLIAEVIHGVLREEHEEAGNARETRGVEEENAERTAPASSEPLLDLDLRWSSRKTRKTIILASHVAAEMLMPDRVFDMHADGTLHEIHSRRKPTREQIDLQKEVWRMALAAPGKGSHRLFSSSGTPSPAPGDILSNSASFALPGAKDQPKGSAAETGAAGSATAAEVVTPTSENKGAAGAPAPAASLSPKRFSLLPKPSDLKRIFVDYVGPRRALALLFAIILAQTFQTFMDNWLGIWMSLHREEEDDSLRARLLRWAALPIALVKGSKTASAQDADPNTLLYFLQTLWAGSVDVDTPAKPWWALLVDVFYHYFVISQDAVVLQFLFSYALIGLVTAAFSFVRIRNFAVSFQRIADTLQLRAVNRLLHAPVSFFDRVPSSGLLHVLSRDQEVVDYSLGESTELILFTLCQLFAMICFNAVQHKAFLVVVPLSGLLFYHLTVRFLLLTKQVRTLESKLHGRSVTVLKESVRGAVTVRAYGPQMLSQMEVELAESLDAVHVAGNAGLAADRWVALRLELVSQVMTATLALLSVSSMCFSERSSKQKKGNVAAAIATAAYAGLGITSSLSTARSLTLLCRRIGMFQNQYVSADALLHLETDTPQEKLTMLGKQRAPTRSASIQRHYDFKSPDSSSTDAESSLSSASFFGSEHDETEDPLLNHAAPPLVLDVRHISAKYQPQLSWVLRDVCFKVHAGECVGLIGRTGNGKSSVFNALLQLMDVVKGDMFVNVAAVPKLHKDKGDRAKALAEDEHPQKHASTMMRHALHMSPVSLRRHFFELVSQEPLLVQGTCRSNLLLGLEELAATGTDTVMTDALLWDVLHKVGLHEMLLGSATPSDSEDGNSDIPQDEVSQGSENPKAASTPVPASEVTTASASAVEPPSAEEMASLLDFPVSAGGSNLSAGQRQLLCLARALLHQPQMVLLDEVSSRVDKQTDLLIQRIIHDEILCRKKQNPDSESPVPGSGTRGCGVLLIAHRLETIMSLCDRVLVIERGRCVADLTTSAVKGLEDLASYL